MIAATTLLIVLAIILAALIFGKRRPVAPDSEGSDNVPTETVAMVGSIQNDEKGYVDLGLPSGVKWATRNVGAANPGDYGDYFGWGETATKSSYDKDNSIAYNKDFTKLLLDKIIESSGILKSSHDVASKKLGKEWHIPTRMECEELIKECVWTWTNYGGHAGYKVTGPNGNSIFLPAAGDRNGNIVGYEGKCGRYWTSSVNENIDNFCYSLNFYNGNYCVDWNEPFSGRCIRPVMK